MSYTNKANSIHPAHYVFIIDTSLSMKSTDISPSLTRIDVVIEAIMRVLGKMLARSTATTEDGDFGSKSEIHDRFKIAFITYNDEATNLWSGFIGISRIIKAGKPKIEVGGNTNTYSAFQMAESLIQEELAKWQKEYPEVYPLLPAPVICHITDGEWNVGGDPRAVVQSIMNTHTPDGNVLVENVFVSKNILANQIEDFKNWKGISSTEKFTNDYAKVLRDNSSIIPSIYRENLNKETDSAISEGAYMMIPGESPELIVMAVTMATRTKT